MPRTGDPKEKVVRILRGRGGAHWDQLGTHCGHSFPFCGPGPLTQCGQCILPTRACLIQTGSSGMIHSPNGLFGVGGGRKEVLRSRQASENKGKGLQIGPLGHLNCISEMKIYTVRALQCNCIIGCSKNIINKRKW